MQGTDISRLGQLGALNQAQAQAQLDAQREATRMAAFQPQEELNRFADITTGIMGGMRVKAQRQQTYLTLHHYKQLLVLVQQELVFMVHLTGANR